MPTLIITGSGGFIGSELTSYFLEKGWKVRSFQRTAGTPVNENHSFYHFELRGKMNASAFSGADFLIHCAVQKYDLKNKNSDEINIEGTKRIIENCRKENIKMIFISTMSAHKEAASHYGKNKLLLESFFDPEKDLVFKLGLVLGKQGLFHTISEMILKGKFIPMIGGNKPIQTLAIEDLCKITKLGIEKGITGNYSIGEPQSIPLAKLYRTIAEKFQKNPVFVPFPESLALWMTSIAEFIGIALPISRESVLGLIHLKKFETQHDLEKFGVKLKTYSESIGMLADKTQKN